MQGRHIKVEMIAVLLYTSWKYFRGAQKVGIGRINLQYFIEVYVSTPPRGLIGVSKKCSDFRDKEINL